MNGNKESEINNAFFQGLIGLAAVFFTVKEYIEPANFSYYLALIVLFLLVSLARVFGTILDFKKFNTLAEDVFSLLITPFTAFVFTRILVTQLLRIQTQVPEQINILPLIVMGYVFREVIDLI